MGGRFLFAVALLAVAANAQVVYEPRAGKYLKAINSWSALYYTRLPI